MSSETDFKVHLKFSSNTKYETLAAHRRHVNQRFRPAKGRTRGGIQAVLAIGVNDGEFQPVV